MTSRSEPTRAAVVGTGLIGGSLGLALRSRGWHVTGSDSSAETEARALELGVVDEVGEDPDAEITFVATPFSSTVDVARRILDGAARGSVVTDVAGVKAAVTRAIGDPWFVGGHPMAGSEQVGPRRF